MEPNVELMYKPPGLDHHKNITDVLDEIILELKKLNERVLDLEELAEQLYLEMHD